MRTIALLALLGLTAAGCQFPRDPDGTLDRVRGGVLRVGVTDAAPWVITGDGRPTGVEIRLIDEFARTLDAEVELTTGSEEELVGALHEGALDLVAGGITQKSPWIKEAAPTRPYATTRLVVGVPPDTPEPATLAVERGTEAAGLVERPAPVEELQPGRAAAVEEWRLDDLGLRRVRVLREHRHVLLSAMGENAFLVELERFLEDRRDAVREMLP